MTSSNGNIFCVTGPLCGEFTAHGEFPTQRPVTRSFDVFFDVHWINVWVNNRETGDLKYHPALNDVIVMQYLVFPNFCFLNTKSWWCISMMRTCIFLFWLITQWTNFSLCHCNNYSRSSSISSLDKGIHLHLHQAMPIHNDHMLMTNVIDVSD